MSVTSKIFFNLRALLQQSLVAPCTQLLLLGNQKISDFSYKSYAGHPRFFRFRALDTPQFSLEHTLESEINHPVPAIATTSAPQQHRLVRHPFTVFSTFVVDKLGKINQHQWQEHLKISKIAEFESDLTKLIKIQFPKVAKSGRHFPYS